MESVLVGRIVVDELDDVNLSAIRPILTYGPKCRPDGGTMSKFQKIGDHKSAIVRSLAGDADGSSVAARGNVGGVVDHHNSSTIRLNVGEIRGVLLGFVNHISVCRVGLSEKIPSVKEGLALKLVLQLILGGSCCVEVS